MNYKEFEERVNLDMFDFKRIVTEIKDKLVDNVQSSLKELGTYKTQKNGIDSKTWKRVMERPENVSIDSLFKIQDKIKGIKKGRI